MGHPKAQTSATQRPKRPYDAERISREKKLMASYGLRRKTEVWRAEALLRAFRQRARALLGRPDPKLQSQLLAKLRLLGLKAESLEDVLGLRLEDILSRRLQSIVHNSALARTVHQARQLIVHRHVRVAGRKVTKPSYLVRAHEEGAIELDQKIKQS